MCAAFTLVTLTLYTLNFKCIAHKLQACVRSGRGQMSSTLYDQMGKSGLRPDAVAKSTLIRAHTASNDITAAVTALLRMENALPLDDDDAATTVAVAVAATRTTAASKKRRAPLEAYHAIIEAAALSGQYSVALQLLERLMAIGYTPSETTARCLAASSAIGHNRYRSSATPVRSKRVDANSSFRGKWGATSTFSSSTYSRDQAREVKSAAVARVDYLLRVADMTAKGAQRSAHGVLYIALLADCLAAERIDVAKDIIGSRYCIFIIIYSITTTRLHANCC
jgi:hypothetical protein